MSVVYMQTFVKLKHVGSDSCNMETIYITLFPFVWQPFTEH